MEDGIVEDEIRKRLILNFDWMFQNGLSSEKEEKRTKKFLNEVLGKYDVCFITESKSEVINKYLKKLENKNFQKIYIFGEIEKLFVDEDFKTLPKCICPRGFPPEGILLRRKEYYQKLKELEEEKGFYPSITTVIGGIYALDLALPDYLGHNIIQIENGYSKKHERDYLGKRFVKNYNELEKLLFD